MGELILPYVLYPIGLLQSILPSIVSSVKIDIFRYVLNFVFVQSTRRIAIRESPPLPRKHSENALNTRRENPQRLPFTPATIA